MRKATEQRFKEFKTLRTKRMKVSEAAEILGVHKVTANRYERKFKAEGYNRTILTREQRFRDYKALRISGVMIGKAAEILGVSRGTASRYEQMRKAENYPQRIANTERWFDELITSGAPVGDVARASDALLKLKAAYKKYG